MSVAPLSSARPSAATLEQALRHAVQKVFNSGNLENLTVKRVRKTVEVDLDLGEDFFKTDVAWTSKSKLVIQAEVDQLAEIGERSSLPTLSQSRTTPPKPQDQHRKPRGTKRASTEKAGPKKRRKQHDSEGGNSARQEEASKQHPETKLKAKQRGRKRDDLEGENQASETDSDFGEDEEFDEVKSARSNGNRAKKQKSSCDSPEMDSGDDEEKYNKPAKSNENGVKDQGGSNKRIGKKTILKENAPKKPAAKDKAIKRNSFTSVSPNSKEEEDITPSVQARVSPSDDLGEQSHPESELSELIDKPPKTKKGRKSQPGEPKTEKNKPSKLGAPSKQSEDSDPTKDEQSDSSMSVLIDEPPKPQQNRKNSSLPPKHIPTKSSKAKKPTETPSDPNLEEIKRLQSQLVKCGIRKMWFKELSPYPTSKSKVKHLKEILSDAGMAGRFSEAKAEQIREERELRADLEAVQEGERKWGKVEEESGANGGGGGGGKGKRVLARGFEGLGFLNDDDGEETD